MFRQVSVPIVPGADEVADTEFQLEYDTAQAKKYEKMADVIGTFGADKRKVMTEAVGRLHSLNKRLILAESPNSKAYRAEDFIQWDVYINCVTGIGAHYAADRYERMLRDHKAKAEKKGIPFDIRAMEERVRRQADSVKKAINTYHIYADPRQMDVFEAYTLHNTGSTKLSLARSIWVPKQGAPDPTRADVAAIRIRGGDGTDSIQTNANIFRSCLCVRLNKAVDLVFLHTLIEDSRHLSLAILHALSVLSAGGNAFIRVPYEGASKCVFHIMQLFSRCFATCYMYQPAASADGCPYICGINYKPLDDISSKLILELIRVFDESISYSSPIYPSMLGFYKTLYANHLTYWMKMAQFMAKHGAISNTLEFDGRAAREFSPRYKNWAFRNSGEKIPPIAEEFVHM